MERQAPYSDEDTSRDAAESVEPHIARLQEMILAALKGSGPDGLCCFEIEERLGLIHQTASARIRGLVIEKLVEASGEKRPTRTGRMAKAWRISRFGTRSMIGERYKSFIQKKAATIADAGFDTDTLSGWLFPFQADIVRWALKRGRAAVFADCGLGKTPMQLEWARQVVVHTGGDVLILAPLAVSSQTKREADKFHVGLTLCRETSDIRPGINVTNYERLERFTSHEWAGVVLDESSILKSYDGSTRMALTAFAERIPFRLACTATPAPNDTEELANHADFLGVMSGKEMLALYFTQDGNTTHAWRLKKHARKPFWSWISSWAFAIRRPSDAGHDDNGFVLPPLNILPCIVPGADVADGMLFPMEASTLQERRSARRGSIDIRVQKIAEIVNASSEPWIVWCNLNAESVALTAAINGAVEVTGSDTADHKEAAMLGFCDGRIRVIVTKPLIAGFGLNLQHCANMAFVGLSDSYEQYYQALRRCWRFGQKNPVNAYIVTADTEGAVLRNIQRKEIQSAEMMEEIVNHTREAREGKKAVELPPAIVETGSGWTLYNGDCVTEMRHVADESVGLEVFSPPFPGMYAYTDSPFDMGNVKNTGEMIEQFRFLIPELLRVLMPGRSCAVHLTQGVAFKAHDGYIGIKDFRGDVIRAFEEAGFIYYGEVAIDKDPQVKAIRTKDAGLLFKSLATDSSRMHMALADYLLQFRKPGENRVPIRAGISEKYGNASGWITSEEWIEWAAPVWYRAGDGYPGGIRETDVLNVRAARDEKDERHLAPLQLGVIERAVKLWSAPGETVLSPFAGIGSEGHVALQNLRRFIGIELKRSYFETAKVNLAAAERQIEMPLLAAALAAQTAPGSGTERPMHSEDGGYEL